MAPAAVEVAVGRLTQTRRDSSGAGERVEGIDIALAILDFGDPQRRLSAKSVLDERTGDQGCGRVHSEHGDAVERHRASKDLGGAKREVTYVVTSFDDLNEIADLDGGWSGATTTRQRIVTVARNLLLL